MNEKTRTPQPLENSEGHQSQTKKEGPQEKTVKRGVGPENKWRNGSMIGAKFGRLTVVGAGFCKDSKTKKSMVPCQCECGTFLEVLAGKLHSDAKCKLCHYNRIRKHGGYLRQEYKTWQAMIQRCGNPNSEAWKWYGGRGISVCDRWMSFGNFYSDMGPKPSPSHSLDRIDNEGGYSPENCRWATKIEQGRNTRRCRRVEAFGVVKTLTEWSEISEISYSELRRRLSLGWSAEKAISTGHLNALKNGR